MSALENLDMSQFTTPLSLQQLFPVQSQSTTAEQVKNNVKLETPNISALEEGTPKVDLNSYYSNLQKMGLNTDVESDMIQTADNLNNVLNYAAENGLNVQDIVNIQKAKAAFNAEMNVFKASSTFELVV